MGKTIYVVFVDIICKHYMINPKTEHLVHYKPPLMAVSNCFVHCYLLIWSSINHVDGHFDCLFHSYLLISDFYFLPLDSREIINLL